MELPECELGRVKDYLIRGDYLLKFPTEGVSKHLGTRPINTDPQPAGTFAIPRPIRRSAAGEGQKYPPWGIWLVVSGMKEETEVAAVGGFVIV